MFSIVEQIWHSQKWNEKENFQLSTTDNCTNCQQKISTENMSEILKFFFRIRYVSGGNFSKELNCWRFVCGE